LRVHVYQEDPFAGLRKTGSKIDRGRGLADSPFLIGDGVDQRRAFPFSLLPGAQKPVLRFPRDALPEYQSGAGIPQV